MTEATITPERDTYWRENDTGRACVVHLTDEAGMVILRNTETGQDTSIHRDLILDRFSPMSEDEVAAMSDIDTDDPDELKRRLGLHQNYVKRQRELVDLRKEQQEKVRIAKDELTKARKDLSSIEQAIADLIEAGPSQQQTLFDGMDLDDDIPDDDEDMEE